MSPAQNPIETEDVLDLLSSLIDKSLVVYDKDEHGQGRYRLLETVRQYARDCLQKSGEFNAAGRQTADWFLGFAEQAQPCLKGPEQASWLSRLETEHDNLRASLSWYEQSEEQGAADSSLRLTGTLGLFWAMHGHFSEGRQWLGRALERTKGSEASAARGKALQEAGALAYDQGDHAAARACYQESLTIKRRLADEGGSALSLQSLGIVNYSQGDYAAAQALLEEALAIQRRQKNHADIANSLYNLGGIAHNQGDPATANTLFAECLALRRREADARGIAIALAALGSVAAGQGDLAAARAFQEESLALVRPLGDLRRIANSLVNLGGVATEQGDFSEARGLFEESLALCRQLGHQEGIAFNLEGMAGLARKQGNYAEAQTLQKESLTLYWQMGDQAGLIVSFEGLAEAAHGQNEPSHAAWLWGAADCLRETLGSPVPPVERAGRDRQLALVREALGENACTAALAEGRAMSLEQAVQYALASG